VLETPDQAANYDGQKNDADRTMEVEQEILRGARIDARHENPEWDHQEDQDCRDPMKNACAKRIGWPGTVGQRR
jgi:hypothetical protein